MFYVFCFIFVGIAYWFEFCQIRLDWLHCLLVAVAIVALLDPAVLLRVPFWPLPSISTFLDSARKQVWEQVYPFGLRPL